MANSYPTDCQDYLGRKVVLPNTAADHIVAQHPEMRPYLRMLSDVLQSPDYVYEQARLGQTSILYYRSGKFSGSMAGAYMQVVVRYNIIAEGIVITAFPTSRIRSHDRLIYER